MSKPRIKASDLVQDIRNGMDGGGLMKKYELSSAQLATVLARLIAAKRITKEEIDSRSMAGKPDPSKPINSDPAYEELKSQRKAFICGVVFLFLVFIAQITAGSIMRPSAEGIICAICMIGLIILVINLSRFLKQPIWLTVLYCLCAVTFFLGPVAIVALIIQSTKALRMAKQFQLGPAET